VPYIDRPTRAELDPLIEVLAGHVHTPGELAYCLTKLMLSRLPPRDLWDYRTLSALRGVIQDVSDEFYRRVLVEFEEQKRDINGDVY
jgi:hypothetical protein